jgi:hypothetical protein
MLSADGPLLMSYICVNPVLVRCSLAIQTAHHRTYRANKSCNPAQAYRRGFIGSGKVERWKFIHEAQAYSFRSRSQEDQPGVESAMGKESFIEQSISRSKN